MITRTPSLKNLLVAIGIPLAVGGLSALVSLGAFGRYASDAFSAPLAPPAWLFPVVWTVLYILMGVSSYLVWITPSPNRSTALLFYGIGLFLNALWTPIFFNGQAFLFAFIWLVLLWVAVLIMTVLFFTVNETAGLLQIPYLLWVTFAGYLNWTVYLANR